MQNLTEPLRQLGQGIYERRRPRLWPFRNRAGSSSSIADRGAQPWSMPCTLGGSPMSRAYPAWSDRVITSREDAGNVLCELFLTNAFRGDNAANDQLVEAMVGRMRSLRVPADGDR